MTVKIKIMDLDKPNLNGVVFTEKAIKNACSQIKDLDIPVVYNSDIPETPSDNIKIGDVIGFAKLLEENYPDMSFKATIGQEQFKDSLKNGWGGFGPNYKVTTKFDDNIIIVTDAEIDTIGYTMTPASETSYEIIK